MPFGPALRKMFVGIAKDFNFFRQFLDEKTSNLDSLLLSAVALKIWPDSAPNTRF